MTLSRWWKRRAAVRRARLHWSTHVPGCPQRPVFVPVEAIGRHAYGGPHRPWPVVHYPPEPCALPGCTRLVAYSTRENRSKRKAGRVITAGRVYCSPEHKARMPIINDAPSMRVKGPAFTTPVRHPETCPRPEKLAFATQLEAEAWFAGLMVADPALHAYRCACHWWHVGHPIGEKPAVLPSYDPSRAISAIARFTPLKRRKP